MKKWLAVILSLAMLLQAGGTVTFAEPLSPAAAAELTAKTRQTATKTPEPTETPEEEWERRVEERRAESKAQWEKEHPEAGEAVDGINLAAAPAEWDTTTLSKTTPIDFPDPVVKAYMIDPKNGFDKDGNGEISEWEGANLPIDTTIRIRGEATDVTGLEKLSCITNPEGGRGCVAFDLSGSKIKNGVAKLISEGYWRHINLQETLVDNEELAKIPNRDNEMTAADYDCQSQTFWQWANNGSYWRHRSIWMYATETATGNNINTAFLWYDYLNIVNVHINRYYGNADAWKEPLPAPDFSGITGNNTVQDLWLEDLAMPTLQLPNNISTLRLDEVDITNWEDLKNHYLYELDIQERYEKWLRGTGISDDIWNYINNLNAGWERSMRVLRLSSAHITDISPLAKAEQLEHLNLEQLDVSDISPLMGCQELRWCYISNLPIADISPLAELRNMRSFQMSNTLVSDLNPLRDAFLNGNFNYLFEIWDCPISDITPLYNYPGKSGDFRFRNNLISLTGDNLQTYNTLKDAGNDISVTRQFENDNYRYLPLSGGKDTYDGEQYYYYETIKPELHLDKTSFQNGDTITAVLELSSASETAYDVEFAFNDDSRIEVVSGSKKQSVTITPGDGTVKKTITFKAKGFSDASLADEMLQVKAYVTSKATGARKLAASTSAMYADRIDLTTPIYVIMGDKVKVWGKTVQGMPNIQIIDSETKAVLATTTTNTEYYHTEFDLPKTYTPPVNPGVRTLWLEAVASSGKTSPSLATQIVRTSITLTDLDFKLSGSQQRYGVQDHTIYYYGDTLSAWARLEDKGVDKIKNVYLSLDGATYQMQKVSGGRYDGYYHCESDPILTTGYNVLTLLLVETTAGTWFGLFITAGKIIIDPSGIITDSKTGEPVPNVKVTLEQKQSDGSWKVWDAEEYLQQNPVYTNDKGYYGWDVPEGTYRVIAEREGYEKKVVERYDSRDTGVANDTITIMPPRLDVDFTMDPIPGYTAPTLDEAKAMVISAIEELKTTALPADNEAPDVEDIINAKLPEKWNVYFKSSGKTASTRTEQGKIEGKLAIFDTTTDEVCNGTYDASVSLLTDENADDADDEEITPPTPIDALAVSDGYIGVASQGAPFAAKLKTSDGGTYTFEAIDGMPAGMTLSADGTVSGTPTQMGTYPFIRIRMTDGAGKASEVYNMRLPVLKQRVDFTVTNNVVAHDGQPHKATVVPTDAALATSLVEGRDYEVLYGGQSEQTDVATYAIKVKMIGSAYNSYAPGKLSLKTLVIRPASEAGTFKLPVPAAMTK